MSIRTEYPDGIRNYVSLKLDMAVYFPFGDVRCKWCRFCIYDRNRGGYMCRCTDDILYRPDKGVGIGCPLEPQEGEEHNGSDE